MPESLQEQILSEWAIGARRSASARGLSAPELTNMLPDYLSALLAHKPATELRAHLEIHLANRIRLGFDIAEMVQELVILEQCIVSILGSAPALQRPTREETERLTAALQSGVVAVTDVFQEHMRLDAQHEKRCARMLDAIAGKALREPDAPLRGALQEALSVVIAAMDAQIAAILLYDPDTRRPIAEASVGIAASDIPQPPASFGLTSFAGDIAAQEHPVSVLDVAIAELDVSELLRRSGIHSLLGVGLRSRRELLGVLYIGLREQRPFSRREIARLETLADRLALNLDNARLYAELREHIDELGRERALREQFVALVAHDLRGPLSAAQLGAQALLRHPDRPSPSTRTRIARNLDRIDRMIRDLLDVSRLRAGERLPLVLERCDLAAVAREVLEELRAAHGDRFQLVADGAVQGMWGCDELRRALWNLGVNAIKYGAPGSPVAVFVERCPGGARISVHNSGPPIPEEDQARLFDLFVRSKSTPPAGSGWGLGLALVRACAEAHGGKVEVQSSEEAGTTFTIDLPLDARPYH